MPLLEIRNLSVEFQTARGAFHAVEGLDLTVESGEVLGIVGESGSGKSVSMLAVMGLIAWPGRVSADRWLRPGVAGDGAIDAVESIDYKETRGYVKRVIESANVYHDLYFGGTR
jgi:ABC-type dipeptide/oligopeptide/nickel transport system ATPase component